jgi:hypothetical protein
MENKINPDTERWVEERMALLAAPDGWEPDAGVARARLQGRLSARRPILARTWLLRAAVVAAACLILLFAIPTTRAWTQQLWSWLAFKKVEVVQGDFQKLNGIWLVPQMVEKELKPGEKPPPLPPAVNFTEATSRAGFTPRLPREGAPPVDPVFRVLPGPMVWSTTLNVAKMEESLRQAGVTDQPIPKEWDGVVFSLTIGSAVSSTWNPGDMSLSQHTPFALSAPAGFDITVYWMAALRAAGIPREQARELAERMRATPALLLGIASNNKKSIREVNLRSGPATLIETRGERRGGGPYPTDVWESIRRFFEDIFDERKGGGHVLLIWGVEDRVYHLAAKSAEQAITAANSIE